MHLPHGLSDESAKDTEHVQWLMSRQIEHVQSLYGISQYIEYVFCTRESYNYALLYSSRMLTKYRALLVLLAKSFQYIFNTSLIFINWFIQYRFILYIFNTMQI